MLYAANTHSFEGSPAGLSMEGRAEALYRTQSAVIGCQNEKKAGSFRLCENLAI